MGARCRGQAISGGTGCHVTGLWVLLIVLVIATVLGLVYRSRNGRINTVSAVAVAGPDDPPAAIDSEALPPEVSMLNEVISDRMGDRATVVQFSSAFCQPCRATRRILEEVTVMLPGVAHVELDAEDHLDLVRALDIRRTPTVLFLDSTGIVRKQASGQPRKADVISALGDLIPEGSPDFEI